MKPINKLKVYLKFKNQKIDVGELVLNNSKIYFKYFTDFLESNLNISPIKLPFNSAIQNAKYEPFNGLFGVFDDSLPDEWGRLLLDKKLASQGENINQLSSLDRLALIGKKGPGALCYEPIIENENINKEIELDIIAKEMQHLINGYDSDLLDDLYRLGGSSGGARPKILVAFNPSTNHILYNTENHPEGYEHWIIKFPSSIDINDIAKVEYAYYKMAIDCGINMSNCRLFKGKSGKVYFGTKRFDRDNNQRLHLHSASGLMYDNFRRSTMDYGHLMDCAFTLENHVKAYEKILRLAAFNLYSHNRDDHSKNFAFLMNNLGIWEFAPAYDLTFSYSSHGYHSTSFAGESKNPNKKHLSELAEHFSISNSELIIDQVRSTIQNWNKYAEEAGIKMQIASKIHAVLKSIQ